MPSTYFPWVPAVLLASGLVSGGVRADAPRVAADIAPVHSLVARVMEGVGSPELIVSSGASPHEYSLRPSEASALQAADVVFWVSPLLTPWMGDAITGLSGAAVVTELVQVEGTTTLDFREGAMFEEHEHHGDEHHGDEHDGDEHDGHDPHAWLSVDNGMLWLEAIAEQLSDVDPDNAQTYAANALAAQSELEALSMEIESMLEPIRNGRFIVFHDAYQYFERRFDMAAAGAISLSDAQDPSPARIAEIRDRVAEDDIDCVLAEPQFNRGIVDTVLDGTGASTGVMDPLGAELEPGPELYPQLLRNLATTLVQCL